MRAHPKSLALSLLAVLAAVPACDMVERVRGRTSPADTVAAAPRGSGLVLGLQAPGALRPGAEGRLRVTVTNRGDSAASGVRMELVVPGWVEPMPPRSGDREVTMSASEDGGTRFLYAVSGRPLAANATETVEQRIRVPPSGPLSQGAVPWTRLVRARLLGPAGQPLAEVETEIALEGVAAPDSARSAPAAADSTATRDRVGPVQLGMTAAALRQAVPAARDTTWTREGTAEKGLVVPAGEGRAVAVLAGDSVVRVEMDDPALRTRERLGVGSRMEELRAAYGAPCVGRGEGIVVVWFARAPGISFALDVPPATAAALRTSPDRIPATARVTRWWLRRGADGCAG